MLYQHGTVARQRIANQFPANQAGMVIGRLQYDYGFTAQARGVCPLYGNGCSHIKIGRAHV